MILLMSLSVFVQIIDYHLGDDASEGIYDGVCGNAFDAQIVAVQKNPQGKGVVFVSCQNKVRDQPLLRRKDVLPLWKFGPYCAVMLQSKEPKKMIMPKIWMTIMNLQLVHNT